MISRDRNENNESSATPNLPVEKQQSVVADNTETINAFTLANAEIIQPSVLFHDNFVLPNESVNKKMQVAGFPELNLLWQAYLKQNQSQNNSDNLANIQEGINRHTYPLFGWPKLISGMVVLGSTVLAQQYIGLIMHETSSAASALLSVWLGGNLASIGILMISGLQRYFYSPLIQVMSRATGLMLKSVNFRQVFEQQDRVRNFRNKAEDLNITGAWDQPNYCKHFLRTENNWAEYSPLTLSQQVHRVLQDFLGVKDPDTRLFQPGKFFSSLNSGKKSVTRFVNSHKTELERSKSGALNIEEGVELLKVLLASELTENTSGARYLVDEIKRLSGTGIKSNEVMLEVWKRDPWTDLTHQEEFFSSASLRGVKKMGRDSKGRVGPFCYLLNPSISALDFSTSKGREVRARCGIALVSDRTKHNFTALFIDGVEGSNAIPTDVIYQGIEQYAKDCQVDLVCFNSTPLNTVPRRFINYVSKCGLPLRAMNLEYLDSTTREYLDAFGVPLQPFEYALPKGRCLVYMLKLNDVVNPEFTEPNLLDHFKAAFKKRLVWCYFSQAMVCSAYIVSSVSLELLFAVAAVGAAAAMYQIKFQNRSLVKK